MRFSRSIFALCALARAALAQQNATTTISPQDATTFSLIYGYPLLAFERLASLVTLITNGTNGIYHNRALATASLRVVVAPNVDTLYSAMIYDLSSQDVTIKVPETPTGLFGLFSFYDFYGDNYVNFGGTESVATPGTYLLTLRSNGSAASEAVGLGVSNGSYTGVIVSPTTYGILLVRTLVNDTNLPTVHTFQDGIAIHNVSVTDGRATTAPWAKIEKQATPAEQVLTDLARDAATNQPILASEQVPVQTQLQAAGLSADGSYQAAAGVDLTAANTSAVEAIAASKANPENYVPQSNGWKIVRPGLAGNFTNGTDYAFRASTSFAGYIMLAAPNAIYPTWTNASDATTSQSGNSSASAAAAFGAKLLTAARDEAIVYTFVGGRPSLKSKGFWSLTAYAPDGFLIPNAPGIYALGDRSNLTYSDGTAVYPRSADGRSSSTSSGNSTRPFQILIQAADNPPPANWTHNWIPAPSGGGDLSASLRWYGAEDSLVDGTYQYPVVTRRAAITASGNGTAGSPSGAGAPSSTGAGSHCPVIGMSIWVVAGAVAAVLVL